MHQTIEINNGHCHAYNVHRCTLLWHSWSVGHRLNECTEVQNPRRHAHARNFPHCTCAPKVNDVFQLMGLSCAQTRLLIKATSGMLHIVGEWESAHAKLEARTTLGYVQ